MRTLIGIDPGLKGGIAFNDGCKLQAYPLPILESKLVDCAELAKQIYLLDFTKEPVVYIEDVHAMPKQGVVSMFNFGRNVGQLIGLFQAIDCEVKFVRPQVWKKNILKDYDTHNKDAAIDYVSERYKINLIPPNCRKPHDGMADAVCIWEYALRQEDAVGGYYE